MTVVEYLKDKKGVQELNMSLQFIGIQNDNAMTNDLVERLDEIWEVFGIDDGKDAVEVLTILITMGVDINVGSDEEFIEKIKAIEKTIEYLGYDDISQVTAEELSKIEVLFEGLDKDIAETKISDAVKIKKMGVLADFNEFSLEEAEAFVLLSKALGINLSKSKSELGNTKYVVDFMENQDVYGRELLKESNIKKLSTLCDALKLNDIGGWNEDTAGYIEVILKEFGINFNKASNLKLKSSFKKIAALNLGDDLEKVPTKIEVMKEFVEDLQVLGLEEMAELTANKNLIDLELIASTREKLEYFGIDVSGGVDKYKKLEEFLSFFGVKTVELRSREAEELAEILNILGVLKDGIADTSKKTVLAGVIKTFEYDELVNLSVSDIEKLKIIGDKLTLSTEQIWSIDGINRIKLILETLQLNIKDLREREVEDLGDALIQYGINEALQNQGYVSWAVSGAEAVIKNQTKEFIAKVKLLGYEITEFDADEYNKIEIAIGGSFSGIKLAELQKIVQNYEKLGIEIARSRVGEIEEVKEVIELLKLSIINDQEMQNLSLVTKEFEIDVTDLTIYSIELFAEYEINLKEPAELQIKQLSAACKRLGYEIHRIREEDAVCIAKAVSIFSQGDKLTKLAEISGNIEKITKSYSDFREEECRNFLSYVDLLSLAKGAKDQKIAIYKAIEEKCQLDYREDPNQEAQEAILRAIESYEKYEACDLAGNCGDLVNQGIERFDEIISKTCNVHEEL